MRLARPAAVASVLVSTVLAMSIASPASADIETPCLPDEAQTQSAEAGFPLTSMRIPEAHAWLAEHHLPEAGAGVVVAVLDSGISTAAKITPAGAPVLLTATAGAQFYHGTAVAGIIAGQPDGDQPIGIAPGASVLDVKVYDTATADGTTTLPITSERVSAGLQAVLAAKKAGVNIKVANVSASVPDAVDLSIVVDRLWKAGVIVVASSGNRVTSQDDPLFAKFGSYQAGENAADAVFPAGYAKAVATSTTADDGLADTDPTTYVLQNTAIDVAAPTSGAPTYSLTGTPCALRMPATSWAAAEVSGVLAMLASTYPADRPVQLVNRMLYTTNGRNDVRSPLTGAGVVQPYEALTRPLALAADGSYDQSVQIQDRQAASLPRRKTDPLRSTRHDMVWFGVLGGGVLVLALVLRPVLARRRRTS